MAFTVRRTKPLPSGCAVFLGILFLAGGLALAWFLGMATASRAREVRSWPEVPCVVKKAEVKANTSGAKPEFQIDAAYEYTRDGRTFTGTKVYEGNDAPEDVNEIEEALYGFRSRPQTVCLVNPQNPEEAVLVKPSYFTSLVILGIGGGLALFGLALLLLPLFRRDGKGGGAIMIPVVCGIFAFAGGACVWYAAKDDWKASAARMKEAPCTILLSRVQENRSTSKGRTKTTYRPEIIFRYEWDGRSWISEWPDFAKNSYSTGSSSGPTETVRRHPAGAKQTCWVDPEKPWVAVLDKKAPGQWLLWIVGSAFGAIGVIGLLYSLAKFAIIIGTMLRTEKPSGPPPLPPE